MSTPAKSNETLLEEVVNKALLAMKGKTPDSDEFTKMVANVTKLYQLRDDQLKINESKAKIAETNQRVEESKAKVEETHARIAETHHKKTETEMRTLKLQAEIAQLNEPDKIDKATLATIAANVGTVLLVLKHERAHIITTKALSFLTKLR